MLASISVALIGCAVYAGGRIEVDSAVHAGQQQQAAERLLNTALDEQAAARGFLLARGARFLALWRRYAVTFDAVLAAARSLDDGDPVLREALADQAQLSAAWRADVAGEIAAVRAGGRPPTLAELLRDNSLMQSFDSANALYSAQLGERRGSALALASWIAAALATVLSLALLLIGVLVARHGLRQERRRDRVAQELRELLQVSASVQESDMLLIRHVQRVVPGAGAAVLTRGGEGDDELEPVIVDDLDATPLRGLNTARLTPRSCLAMRLSRSYDRTAAEQPLLACEVCGAVAAEIACEPLLVGGQVIGAMLVGHASPISVHARAALHQAVTQAAPILANQRNLALAERRAISDALTGLPNRRAADETIKQLAALAGRSLNPLSIVLLDLDRFKQLNDQHGHDAGDKALATVGQVLSSSLRASDFAARYGGEEFLMVLPDTDRRGAVEVAEKVRRALERIELPRVGALTGSFGVACLPEDAAEPEQLIRRADRALYAAKARGRNRVESAEPAGAGDGATEGGDSGGGELRGEE